jgi:four helix bundle protein
VSEFTIFDWRFTSASTNDNPIPTTPPMTREQMKDRTKAFANRVVRLCSALPANWVAQTLGRQLLRAGTSVGANYRAVCRARSDADFVNKLRIVEEECDESLCWMELLVDNGLVKASRLRDLMREADELLAIVVASAKTARSSAARKSSIAYRK